MPTEETITESREIYGQVDQIAESSDLQDGITATVQSAQIKTKLQPVEEIEVTLRDIESSVIADTVICKEDVSNTQYLEKEDILDSMESEFVDETIIIYGKVYDHINRKSINESSSVLVYKERTDNTVTFYRCNIDHILEVSLLDSWKQNRIIRSTHNEYSKSHNKYQRIIEMVDKDVELSYHNGTYTVEQSTTVNTNDVVLPTLVLGFGIGTATALFNITLASGIGFLALAVFLQYMSLHKTGDLGQRVTFPDSGSVSEGYSILPSELRKSRVMSKRRELISVSAQDSKIQFTADSIDATWSIETDHNNLYNSNTVDLFESIGLSKIRDGLFVAEVRKQKTNPIQRSIECDDGDWHLIV